jgi:hypothetical protein
MILSLILMLVVGVQSCAVTVGDSMGNEKVADQGGPWGIIMAFLFLVGGAFALAFPLVSFIMFVLSGIVGLVAGSATSFSDLTLWGVVSLILALFSFFGILEKRRRRREQSARVI